MVKLIAPGKEEGKAIRCAVCACIIRRSTQVEPYVVLFPEGSYYACESSACREELEEHARHAWDWMDAEIFD